MASKAVSASDCARSEAGPPNRDKVMLSLEGLSVGHSGTAVVTGIDLCVERGEIVAVLGRNGAGKTTLLSTIAGLIRPISGRMQFEGRNLPSSLHLRARAGVGFVTEDRTVIRRLTVLENLKLDRGPVEDVFQRFPELRALKHRRVGLTSGGEQQMLALGRILAARPSLLLIDELSLGLAPIVVERLLLEVRRAAREDNAAVILVEQQTATALKVADRGCVIAGGQIRLSGTSSELRDKRSEIEDLYLAG
jgi:branched-chain amino acid transport system ATP-binding protein